MSLEIPSDIVEEIVRHLPQHWELCTVQSLARVARSFVDPCQRRLFKEISFGLTAIKEFNSDASKPPQSFVRLRDILHQSPRLAGYVKELCFTQLMVPGFYGTEWLTKHPSLFTAIIDSLASSQIVTVTLEGPCQEDIFDWNQLPLDVERIFYRILSNPDLRTVILKNMAISREFFKGLGGLKALELINVAWSLKTHPTPEQDMFRRDMKGVQMPTRIRWETEPARSREYDMRFLDPDTLTAEVGLNLIDVSHASWWIGISYRVEAVPTIPLNLSRLKELYLEVYEEWRTEDTTQRLDLSSCHSLSHLALSQSTVSCSRIITVLSSLPPNHHLVSLSLQFSNEHSSPIDSYSSFGQLSPTLVRLQKGSGTLKRVLIEIRLKTDASAATEAKLVEVRDFVLGLVSWDGSESILNVESRVL